MSSALPLLAVGYALAGAPADFTTPTELRFTGALAPARGAAAGEPIKTFKLYCLVRPAASPAAAKTAARELAFIVDESGDAWPWPERYGRIELGEANVAQNKARIQLLHNHDGTLYPLALHQPLFEYAGKLQNEAVWVDGKHEYEVLGQQRRQERNCWQIEVSTNFGRAQTLWIEVGTGLVIEARHVVFMGQGDRFELTMQFESQRPVSEVDLARLAAPLDTLLALQRDLKRPADTTRPELNAEQIVLASRALETLGDSAAETPLETLARAISRDVRDQSQRADDVESLVKKLVGQPAPGYELADLDGKALPAADRDGRIVVLHFWQYHDDPLSEPYGQVGYLEFLKAQCERRKLPVQIYGVAVDPRLGQPEARGTTVRQIRKLIEFMNLSYPIAADDGSLLREFGDPRRVGADLPLWVVIAPDGTLAHYGVGYYDIKPDQGLSKLQEAVFDVVRKRQP